MRLHNRRNGIQTQKPIRDFRPRMELLEVRQLLACDLQLNDGVLSIAGDHDDNVVGVEDLGDQVVSVVCSDQGGNIPDASLFRGVKSVVARLADGNDAFDYRSKDPSVSDVQAFLGDGDDKGLVEIVSSGRAVPDGHIEMHDGEDMRLNYQTLDGQVSLHAVGTTTDPDCLAWDIVDTDFYEADINIGDLAVELGGEINGRTEAVIRHGRVEVDQPGSRGSFIIDANGASHAAVEDEPMSDHIGSFNWIVEVDGVSSLQPSRFEFARDFDEQPGVSRTRIMSTAVDNVSVTDAVDETVSKMSASKQTSGLQTSGLQNRQDMEFLYERAHRVGLDRVRLDVRHADEFAFDLHGDAEALSLKAINDLGGQNSGSRESRVRGDIQLRERKRFVTFNVDDHDQFDADFDLRGTADDDVQAFFEAWPCKWYVPEVDSDSSALRVQTGAGNDKVLVRHAVDVEQGESCEAPSQSANTESSPRRIDLGLDLGNGADAAEVDWQSAGSAIDFNLAASVAGEFSIPEVEDEVLVMFAHANEHDPVVIEANWKSTDLPFTNRADASDPKQLSLAVNTDHNRSTADLKVLGGHGGDDLRLNFSGVPVESNTIGVETREGDDNVAVQFNPKELQIAESTSWNSESNIDLGAGDNRYRAEYIVPSVYVIETAVQVDETVVSGNESFEFHGTTVTDSTTPVRYTMFLESGTPVRAELEAEGFADANFEMQGKREQLNVIVGDGVATADKSNRVSAELQLGQSQRFVSFDVDDYAGVDIDVSLRGDVDDQIDIDLESSGFVSEWKMSSFDGKGNDVVTERIGGLRSDGDLVQSVANGGSGNNIVKIENTTANDDGDVGDFDFTFSGSDGTQSVQLDASNELLAVQAEGDVHVHTQKKVTAKKKAMSSAAVTAQLVGNGIPATVNVEGFRKSNIELKGSNRDDVALVRLLPAVDAIGTSTVAFDGAKGDDFAAVRLTGDIVDRVRVNLNGRRGDDRLFVDASDATIRPTGELFVRSRGHGGQDELNFVAALQNDGLIDLLLAGGRGKDIVGSMIRIAPESRGHIIANVQGNRGDDRVGLAVFGDPVSSRQPWELRLRGGRGFDVCFATDNVMASGCEEFADVAILGLDDLSLPDTSAEITADQKTIIGGFKTMSGMDSETEVIE